MANTEEIIVITIDEITDFIDLPVFYPAAWRAELSAFYGEKHRSGKSFFFIRSSWY